MKKKLLCLVLIVGVILSISLSVSAKKFDDTLGHWAEEAIDEWKDYGIVNGIGNNMFNPNGYMTRAEAAAVFSRLLVLNDRASVESFKDVDLNAWYVESLEKCVSAGILSGDGNNMNPGGYITREMFFTMFCRAFNIQPEVSLNKEFSDVDEISTWAEGYTYALINQGYVNGMTADTIAPKTNINRASVIALLDRLIANYAVQDGYVLNSTNTGLSLVVADNCTVADGFSGIVVLSGEDTTISFEGASVDTTIIVKADNIVITNVPENVSVTVVKGIENTEVNGKLVEGDNTFTVTVEKVDDSENDEDDKDDEDKKPIIIIGGHTHNYIGAETIKASCTAEGVMTYTCYCGTSYTVSIPKLSKTGEHIPGTAVKENEVAGTCKVEGTYDEVLYCSVCGTHEISRTQKTGEFGAHIPGTPIKENEVAGTCKVEGTYDEVVYCSVCGTHEISRTQKTGEFGEHVPAAAVKENEVAGTCTVAGTYDEVVYCSVCGTHEISRTQKTGEFGEHVPGTAVKENEVAGTCKVEGTYDEVVYCSVCGTHEISRTQKTGELGEHVPGTPVKENEVAGTCLVAGTYDEVVYCSVCGTHEISRTHKTGELGEHVPGTPVKENEVAGTCKVEGTYDEVVYCSVCGTHEISRTQKTGEFGEHVPAAAVKENEVAGNCKVEGTYDEVIYCSVCGTHEISRTQKTGEFGEHVPDTPVVENEVTGTCTVAGTYDEVVYCSVCGTHEISRTQKTGEFGEHVPGTPVKENEVAGTCLVAGTYDEVVYCSVCGTHEISRTSKTSGYGDHVPGTPVVENEVAGTCTVAGTYDEVVYCSVCRTHEISRTQKTGELGDHNFVGGSCEYCGDPETITEPTIKVSSTTANPGDSFDLTISLIENPGIFAAGFNITYDSNALELTNVVLNSNFGGIYTAPPSLESPATIRWEESQFVDNETDDVMFTLTFDIKNTASVGTYAIELEYAVGDICNINEDDIDFDVVNGVLTVVEKPAHTHTPGTPVKENEVAGNCQTPATYDEVVYCSVCGTHEISRTQKTGELGDHNFVGGSCEYCEELDPNFNPESPETSEGLEYDSNGDGTCYLIGIGDCEDTDIVIPETSPDGDTVFAIDRNAFADEAITSITIPTTIEEIGRNAFNGCDSLTDVYYLGTEAEWEALCEEIGTGNNALLNANIHFAQESVTYDGPTIVVESVEANAGDTVEVDVEFANNPGIFVARFTIEYDENALELDSVSLNNTFGGQFTAPELLTSPVTIPWEESQLADNTNSGSMLTLKFKVKDSATSGTHGINITYVKGDICNVNEEDVDFTIINGSITIE